MQKYWWRQTEWHSKMDKSMQVNGMGERTREAYLRSMRQLVEYYDKTPDRITEEELLDYFFHRQDVTRWSPATMRICYSGVKFFFKHILKRDWHLLTIAQARRERRLPAVLSRDEVKKIFSLVRPFHNYACLVTVYSCGLRLQEGLYLEVSNIDGPKTAAAPQNQSCKLANRLERQLSGHRRQRGNLKIPRPLYLPGGYSPYGKLSIRGKRTSPWPWVARHAKKAAKPSSPPP